MPRRRPNDLSDLFSPGTAGDLLFELNLRAARIRVETLREFAPALYSSEDFRDVVTAWRVTGFDQSFARIAELEKRAAQEARRTRLSPDERERAELRDRIRNSFGRVELRGLQLSERILQDIEHVYVPLHIAEEQEHLIVIDSQDAVTRRTERIDIRIALEHAPRLLILGAPGSGKSTLIGFLAVSAVSGGRGDTENKTLPFVVLARSLLTAREISPRIVAEQNGVSVQFVERALASGDALVLVDGLDESIAAADSLLESLGRLANRAHKTTRWLVTSRVLGAPEAETIERSGFQARSLLPMTRSEIQEFVYLWCHAAETSVTYDRRIAMARADAAASDLLSRLDRTPTVTKLVENPLLCSVVCTLHRFLGQRIPERRAALYEAAANLLLYDWDRSKFDADAIIGKLDATQKRALLAALAFEMHRRQVAEISARELVDLFKKGLPEVGADDSNANAIVEEIRTRSGLLVERGPGVYGFSHLTFQEYFTACEVVRHQAWSALCASASSPWWHEVIVLAAGVPGANASDLVEGLLTWGDVGLVLAAQCIDAATTVSQELRQRVAAEIRILIPPRNSLEIDRLVAVGPTCGPIVLEMLNTSVQKSAICPLLPVVEMLGLVGAVPALERIVERPGGIFSDEQSAHRVITHELSPGVGVAVKFVVGVDLHAALTLLSLAHVSERALKSCISLAERGKFRLLTDLAEGDVSLTGQQKRVIDAALKERIAARKRSAKSRAPKRE